LVRESPDNPSLDLWQGIALHAKGDRDGAIACYQKAIDLDPKDYVAHYSLGNALLAKGDLDGAIASFQKALALDPKFAWAHTGLGNALRDKGDWGIRRLGNTSARQWHNRLLLRRLANRIAKALSR
jgi:superkiller protein 3